MMAWSAVAGASHSTGGVMTTAAFVSTCGSVVAASAGPEIPSAIGDNDPDIHARSPPNGSPFAPATSSISHADRPAILGGAIIRRPCRPCVTNRGRERRAPKGRARPANMTESRPGSSSRTALSAWQRRRFRDRRRAQKSNAKLGRNHRAPTAHGYARQTEPADHESPGSRLGDRGARHELTNHVNAGMDGTISVVERDRSGRE